FGFPVFVLLVCISAVYLFLYRETYSRFSKTFFEYTSPLLDSSPCACQKCLSEGDPWFIGHFNKSVQPFLTSEYNIPEDAFNWWKHLQNDRSSLTDYREVVDKLFQIFPNRQYNTEPSPDKCRTCAVVGNSMNLKGSHYGALIDSHDIIIRMNGGHTQGYEADVGTRTTHHVMYPESAMDLGNTTHLVLFPFKTMDLRWLVSAFTTGSITVDNDLSNNQYKKKYIKNIFVTMESSGNQISYCIDVNFALQVSVFGFGADSDGNWSHYWEKLKDKQFRTGLHKGPYEFKVIQQLSERQKLEMFKGL
uniref:CMP-N-acetylneuraminate-beta-galactosamide-alpha-2,3-sialyltransferase 1 n=1 Tax=Myripristis murdjan TaxID=586833 RepID=A0A667XJX7_9TELE